MVTDEITGEKIDAGEAFYVESEIITTPHTGNRIHVFAQKSEAESHAQEFKGKLVNNPFKTKQKSPVQFAEYKNGATDSADFAFDIKSMK